MKVDGLVFAAIPTLVELCDRVHSKMQHIVPTDVMEGRYDAGVRSWEHFVMMPISCELEWLTYVACVSSSQVRYVVVTTCGTNRCTLDPVSLDCGHSLETNHEPIVEPKETLT
jgi:hypothetical protein